MFYLKNPLNLVTYHTVLPKKENTLYKNCLISKSFFRLGLVFVPFVHPKKINSQ